MYKIVSAGNLDRLEFEVREIMRNGYLPVGTPFVSDLDEWSQAMFKVEREKTSVDLSRIRPQSTE